MAINLCVLVSSNVDLVPNLAVTNVCTFSSGWVSNALNSYVSPKSDVFVYKAPFGIGVYKADPELLQYGSELCEEALIKINEWERTNVYPDYTDGVELMGLPPWLKKKEGVTPQNYQEIELY